MTVAPWTPLGERPLVQDRWIDLRLERCRLPTGAVVDDYHVQHHPDWVVAMAVTPEGRFVLVRQWRQGARVVSLEFPGGVIDPGEAPTAAAARELLEETGFRGDAGVDIGWCWTNPASHTNRIHAVLIRNARPVQPPAPDEHEALEVETADAAGLLGLIGRGELAHALHAALAHRLRLALPHLFGDGA